VSESDLDPAADAAADNHWNPSAGRVTRAYDDWHTAEMGLRSFLRLGREFSDEGYESRWERIAKSPGGESGPEIETSSMTRPAV
jgi:hypothetical protein